jgi:hypothetical protein
MLRRMTASPSMPPRRPPALRGRPLALTAIAAALLCLAASQPAGASTHSDRAATSAYLHAQLRFLRSVEANSAAAQASVKALVAKVAGECPQVLAGTPAVPNRARATPAERRLIEQEAAIGAEIETTLLRTWLSPDRQAIEAFLVQTRTLRWSSNRLTRAVRTGATNEQALLPVGIPDICSDASTWVASGYTRLASGTIESERALEGTTGSQPPVEAQLAPYETPSLKKLVRSFAHLKHQLAQHFLDALSTGKELFSTLGFKGEGTTSGKPIGEGHTAIGTSFTISTERETEPETESPSRKQCRLPIETQEGDTTASGCVETGKVGVPEISCQQGLLPITLVTPANAQSVSLLLSDGRQIVSPVIPIPTSLGGPLGYYRQVVRGPSPIPVSLTELDAEGKPLAVVKLRRLVECTTHPVKLVAGGPIAHGSVPHGPSFTITVGRYRYLGQIHKKLTISFGSGSSDGLELVGSPRASFDYATGCTRRPYILIVGVLRSSTDTVFARTAGGLVQLHEAAIAPGVRAGAKIAYQAFATPPSRLILRDAAGRTIQTRAIGRHIIDGCGGGGESEGVGNLG